MSTDFTIPGFVAPVSEGEQFFYDHAGFSYDPETQTAEEGRWECARKLRGAEVRAASLGWEVRWEEDPEPIWDDDVERETTDYPQWWAVLFDSEGNVLGSLGSVDLGPDKDPWSDPYGRVVAAELAWEALS
jgi:hypothetical protein